MHRNSVPNPTRPPKDCVQTGWREGYSCALHKARGFKDQRVPLFRKLWSEHKRSRYTPHDGGGRR